MEKKLRMRVSSAKSAISLSLLPKQLSCSWALIASPLRLLLNPRKWLWKLEEKPLHLSLHPDRRPALAAASGLLLLLRFSFLKDRAIILQLLLLSLLPFVLVLAVQPAVVKQTNAVTRTAVGPRNPLPQRRLLLLLLLLLHRLLLLWLQWRRLLR